MSPPPLPVSDAPFRYARSALHRPSRFHSILPRSISSRFDCRREREPSAATRVSHGRYYRFHLLGKRLAKPSSDARRRTFAFSETLLVRSRVSDRSTSFAAGSFAAAGTNEQRETRPNDKIIGATRAKKGRADSLGSTFAVLGRTVCTRTNSSRNLFPASRHGSDSRTGTSILSFGSGPFASIGSYRPALISLRRSSYLETLSPLLLPTGRCVVSPFSGVNPRPRLFRLTSSSEALRSENRGRSGSEGERVERSLATDDGARIEFERGSRDQFSPF